MTLIEELKAAAGGRVTWLADRFDSIASGFHWIAGRLRGIALRTRGDA